MDITLKDKNGVVLKTEKKYCKEDITVRVDTEELNIIPTKEIQVKEGLFDKVTIKGVVESKANVFMQQTEPEVKEGIWLQKEGSFEKAVVTDMVFGDPYWETAPTTIPYEFTVAPSVSIGTDIYLLGNVSTTGTSNNYKYDTLTNTFTQLNNIPHSFYNGSAAAVGTDIYLFGGSSTANYKYTYKYDTLTNVYTKKTNIPYEFYNGSAVAVGTDIYLLGTYNGSNNYKYDTTSNSYTQLQNIPYSFYNGSAVAVGTDIFLFGTTDSSYRTCAYKYDTLTDTFTKLTNIPYEFRNGSAVAVGTDIYLLGNYSSSYKTYAYKYDTLTDTYTQLTNIPDGFKSGSATLVKDKIYLLGGQGTPTRIETFVFPQGEYPLQSIVIFNGTNYNTQLLSSPDNVEGRILTGIADVSYSTENGLDDTTPTYYGNGTEWIKFKN